MSMPASPPPDDRAERMVEDAERYFADARRVAEAEIAARPPRRQFRRQRYDRPAPGVVQLRLTASCDDDIQALVARLADAGLRLWQAKDRLYETKSGVLCRYYSVNLREQ